MPPYGGVFIVLSILWGWKVDKIAPDKFDLIGGFIALVGVIIIMYWPRGIILIGRGVAWINHVPVCFEQGLFVRASFNT